MRKIIGRKIIGAVVLALLLAGCQTSSETIMPIDATFNPNEAAFIKTKGEGTIKGTAFIPDASGGTHKSAGQIVRLIPASSYARERFMRLYGDKKFVAIGNYPKAEQTDPQYLNYIRSTKTNENGKFEFGDVAAGTYYVSTQVVWRKSNELFEHGGAIFDIVNVTGKEDEPVKVIVSGT